MNPRLSSASGSTSPRSSASAKRSSISRPHSGRARCSSNTEMPSVSQRGMRLCDICSVMTCAISCQSVACQLNVPGRPRARRVERHHAAEAGAERPDHAGQADVAHGEVVVLRKDLDQHAPVDRVPVPGGERVERPARQRQRVLAQHRRLVGMQAHRHHAVFHGLEPLEAVEQPEQVVGDHVVGIGTEGRVERDAGTGFVAGPKQVHAEIGRRAHVARFDLERLARQAGRGVEAIVPRGLRAGDAGTRRRSGG